MTTSTRQLALALCLSLGVSGPALADLSHGGGQNGGSQTSGTESSRGDRGGSTSGETSSSSGESRDRMVTESSGPINPTRAKGHAAGVRCTANCPRPRPRPVPQTAGTDDHCDTHLQHQEWAFVAEDGRLVVLRKQVHPCLQASSSRY